MTDTSEVHYRLYDAGGGPTVICVQDFDYPDYDQAKFLSDEVFTSEAEALVAKTALPIRSKDIIALIGTVMDEFPYFSYFSPTLYQLHALRDQAFRFESRQTSLKEEK